MDAFWPGSCPEVTLWVSGCHEDTTQKLSDSNPQPFILAASLWSAGWFPLDQAARWVASEKGA